MNHSAHGHVNLYDEETCEQLATDLLHKMHEEYPWTTFIPDEVWLAAAEKDWLAGKEKK